MSSLDSLQTRRTLEVDGASYDYFSLDAASAQLGELDRLPVTLKILLENLLRHEDDQSVTRADLSAVVAWLDERRSDHEIAYRPARVLMQDFTGVPAVVDLAAMRDAMVALGGDPERINPLAPVDLVIDHSVMVDHFGSAAAFDQNVALEMARNGERYAFLRWGQQAFANFRVVPPGTGICHQVNLEYLAQTVWIADDDNTSLAYPDTLVGTDSHTTMINGLGVLGWGVGGIEAEAAMLGQPVSMRLPEVVGFRLTGELPSGATATDLVLTVTQQLRAHGVVGKFVEFFGPGLGHLTLPDRATIANMAPEYGATCGFFPVDGETLAYLEYSGRDPARIALVEAYAKAQGLWHDPGAREASYSDVLELDMGSVEPSLAGPKRPQDRILLGAAAGEFERHLAELIGDHTVDDTGAMAAEGDGVAGASQPTTRDRRLPVAGRDHDLGHGDVVIAAITSCTNTSNPSVMVAAGLLARNARQRGLTVKPWVKTSLAPGSQVVSDYLQATGLQDDLDALGFQVVGYGCTTCIGNSGPLDEAIGDAVKTGDLVACSVLSGNRNFEGRIHPQVRANYLASPPLVVAYALAGSLRVDLQHEPLGEDADGNPVYLRDLWPSPADIEATRRHTTDPAIFRARYADVFTGPETWRAIEVPESQTYAWNNSSTYVKNPPYFIDINIKLSNISPISGARVLALLGDSVTTDHISPAGSIALDGPAGRYLVEQGVAQADFNSYGSRRGNHEVMMRGTFANVRLRNEMAPGTSGGVTVHQPSGDPMSIYDAAMRYRDEGVPLVVVAGKEYGTGSSRDWAAKGTNLLGVRAVIAESYERIHRSNLVGMGVLPLQFPGGVDRQTLELDGSETFAIDGLEELAPGITLACSITRADGSETTTGLLCRVDTADELDYYRNGGILPYVLRGMLTD